MTHTHKGTLCVCATSHETYQQNPVPAAYRPTRGYRTIINGEGPIIIPYFFYQILSFSYKRVCHTRIMQAKAQIVMQTHGGRSDGSDAVGVLNCFLRPSACIIRQCMHTAVLMLKSSLRLLIHPFNPIPPLNTQKSQMMPTISVGRGLSSTVVHQPRKPVCMSETCTHTHTLTLSHTPTHTHKLKNTAECAHRGTLYRSTQSTQSQIHGISESTDIECNTQTHTPKRAHTQATQVTHSPVITGSFLFYGPNVARVRAVTVDSGHV